MVCGTTMGESMRDGRSLKQETRQQCPISLPCVGEMQLFISTCLIIARETSVDSLTVTQCRRRLAALGCTLSSWTLKFLQSLSSLKLDRLKCPPLCSSSPGSCHPPSFSFFINERSSPFHSPCRWCHAVGGDSRSSPNPFDHLLFARCPGDRYVQKFCSHFMD